jgi:hypothetical protein
MFSLTPENTDRTIGIMIVGYFITLAYSVFMAFLNYKQSQVKDVLLKTNEILERIEKKLAEKN